VYSEAGRHSEAVERYTASADIMRALHPGGHPVLAVILSNIATEETKLGDHEAALTRYEEALAMRRALVQGHDPQVATFLLNLARTLADLGRREEAVARAREAIEAITDEPLGFIWVGAHQTLADLLRPTDPAAADALLAEARDRCAAADAQTRKAASCDRVE
jgi:tetratricopeptide (TPR) repeat protein